MANTITGSVLKVGQAVNVSRTGKEFLKRELVLDCSRYDQYTGEKQDNFVSLSFTQKRCEELNGVQQGDLVEVSFILSGRKYEKDGQTRFITDVVGYKVDRKEDRAHTAQAPQAPQTPLPPTPQPSAPYGNQPYQGYPQQGYPQPMYPQPGQAFPPQQGQADMPF